MKNSAVLHLSVLLFFIAVAPFERAYSQSDSIASTVYIHDKSRSFNAVAIQSILAVALVNKNTERKLLKGRCKEQAASLPSSLRKRAEVTVKTQDGRNIWYIVPKKNKSNKVILYFHGGAYVENLLSFHWKFIEKMAEETGATFVVPDYPLAPQSQCEQNFEFVAKLYKSLLSSEIDAENLIMMGDSAGGGLTLAFAQHLVKENEVLPKQLILLSPWLDVTMTNVDTLFVAKKDKMLTVKGTRAAGLAYAGDRDPKDYRVSPIYGTCSQLPPISIFIGTYDLLISDCRKLKDQLTQEKQSFSYFEYPKMFHDWILVGNLKEAKHARKQLSELIN